MPGFGKRNSPDPEDSVDIRWCFQVSHGHHLKLKRILSGYFEYYHHWRTQVSLERNSPILRGLLAELMDGLLRDTVARIELERTLEVIGRLRVMTTDLEV